MGQVLHSSATTTAATCRAIENGQESLRALAGRYSVNQKTIAKWRKCTSVEDRPTGPKQAKSTVLFVEDEWIVAFLLSAGSKLEARCCDVLDHISFPPYAIHCPLVRAICCLLTRYETGLILRAFAAGVSITKLVDVRSYNLPLRRAMNLHFIPLVGGGRSDPPFEKHHTPLSN